MDIVRDIAEFKSKNNMSIFQEGRWNELVSKYDKQAEKLGLSAEFVSKIFHQIHLESIEKQNGIINKGEEKVSV